MYLEPGRARFARVRLSVAALPRTRRRARPPGSSATTSTVCREGVFRYITAHSPRHLSRSNGSKSTYWSTRILPSQSRRSLRLKLSTDVYRSRTIPPRETPERISIRHLRQNNYQERMNSRAQCAAQYFSCLWRTSLQSFCCTCFPCGYGVSNY